MKPHLPLGLRAVMLSSSAALAVFAPSSFGAVANTASGTYETAIVNPFDSTLTYEQWVRNAASTGGYEVNPSTSVHWIDPEAGNAVIQITPSATATHNVGSPMNLAGINIALETTNTEGAARNDGQVTINAALNAKSVWFKGGRYQVTTSSHLANAGDLYVQGGQLWINAANQTIANAVTLGGSNYTEGNAFGGASLRLNNTTTTFTETVTVAENTKIGYAAGASLNFSDLTLATGATVTFGKYGSGNDLALTLTGTLRLTGDGGLETGIDSTSVNVTLAGNLLIDLSNYSGTLTDGQELTNFTLGGVSSEVEYTVISGQQHLGYITLDNGAATFHAVSVSADALKWNNAASGEWNTTANNWLDADGNEVAFADGSEVVFSGATSTITVTDTVAPGKTSVNSNSEITLTGGGTVSGPMRIAYGSQVILDNATLSGTISLDSGARIVSKQTTNVTTDTSIRGGGTIELDWGTSNGAIIADLTDWAGILQITSGRYDATNQAAVTKLAQATEIVVTDGGQFFVASAVTCANNFTLSGNGWTDTTDPACQGALRFERGATISGTVTLAGDTGVQLYATNEGTISGAIIGGGHTLTKYGTGTLTIGNTLRDLSLTVDQGMVIFTEGRTYNLDVVTVKSGATIRDKWNNTLNINVLNMEDGSTLDLFEGGSNLIPTLTFEKMNVSGTVTVKNHKNGTLNIAGSIVGDTTYGGTLYLTTGSGANTIDFQSDISGKLNIQKDVGSVLLMSGANTYEGDTIVSAGAINVSGTIEGTDNTYTARETGRINLTSETGSIANSAISVTRNGETNASIQNATVGTSSIDRVADSEQGSIENANMTIKANSFLINNLTLLNTRVDLLQQAGTLTLNNVIIGEGTTVSNTGGGHVALSNSQLVMTTAQTENPTLNGTTLSVSSSALAGYTAISGTLTLDLTKEWVDHLVASVTGNFTTIELTFTGVDESAWEAFRQNGSLAQTGALDYPMFGPPTVTFGESTGSVIISAQANIPEPATATLSLLGLSSLLLRRRRKA